jgi:hypothetical protein
MTSRTKAALGLAVATSLNAFAAPDAPTVGDLRKVGRTHLQTSCNPAVQDDLASGVALLHSFFYEEARRVFTDVAARDGGCAIAHWGIAMTWWHPIWTPPTADERAAGRAAIDKARSIGGRMPLERGLIDALAAYYADPVRSSTGPIGQSCHGATGGGDHAARAAAYEKAMEAVHSAHRHDIEAGTFYALALLASAPPGDRTLENQTRATEILEPLRRRQPDHPGVLHYLIHGYDYPLVAEKGLAAAKAYAAISPWVPHVLHMPSHIFTRLGMWDEVISSNLASSEASRQYEARKHPGATGFEELHAWDYMVYGYLQTAQDARALEIRPAHEGRGEDEPRERFRCRVRRGRRAGALRAGATAVGGGRRAGGAIRPLGEGVPVRQRAHRVRALPGRGPCGPSRRGAQGAGASRGADGRDDGSTPEVLRAPGRHAGEGGAGLAGARRGPSGRRGTAAA